VPFPNHSKNGNHKSYYSVIKICKRKRSIADCTAFAIASIYVDLIFGRKFSLKMLKLLRCSFKGN